MRVFKYTSDPLSTEHQVLAHLAGQGMPVPRLHAAAVRDNVLTMIMEDLGHPRVAATERDAVSLAVQLHTMEPVSWLVDLDETALARLPDQALDDLEELHQAQRNLADNDMLNDLAALDTAAQQRAVGAGRAPWGLCHGALDPSAVHVSESGRHLVDLALAHNGPGLFDLATWNGIRRPPDPGLTRGLIHAYVGAGGHPDALTDRGDLPAERWALGWHRIYAATRRIRRAAEGVDGPERDSRNRQILRGQIREARVLLNS